jgi:hypothetical protein
MDSSNDNYMLIQEELAKQKFEDGSEILLLPKNLSLRSPNAVPFRIKKGTPPIVPSANIPVPNTGHYFYELIDGYKSVLNDTKRINYYCKTEDEVLE